MLKASSATRLLLAVTLVVLVQGCDSARPAPSPVGQPGPEAPVPPLPGMTRLTGLVVEPDGQAVPGAVITWLYGALPSTTVTGGTGAFDLTLDSQPPEVVRLTVEKDGFEPSALYVAAEGKAEVRRDLHLHRIQRITVGESVSLSIGPSDSHCSILATDVDSERWPCRRLRVVSPESGMLTMWVYVAPSGPRYRIQLAANPDDGARSSFSTPVEAGAETVVDSRADGTARARRRSSGNRAHRLVGLLATPLSPRRSGRGQPLPPLLSDDVLEQLRCATLHLQPSFLRSSCSARATTDPNAVPQCPSHHRSCPLPSLRRHHHHRHRRHRRLLFRPGRGSSGSARK